MTPSRRPARRSRRARAAVGLLLAALPILAGATCRELAGDDLQPVPGCSVDAGGALQIPAGALRHLKFDGDGLAALQADGRHYYVGRDGRQLAVVGYDNGPDYFAEGLVRGHVDGGIGFFDHELRPAFAERFDWAWPFRDGIAEACNGCRPGAPDADGHVPMVGGVHFRIDRNGHRIDAPR
ncbi:hypothetical protein OK348_02955 [Flavobacterium sp. MXW15]|uniref:WG repeat-containing protein n=1 Tax=Xanthomonas chitinilytica TaxID=2989819 RepID=A0ABT3JRS3_9XANT|nr:WG repeat-containing protein [Xanthomonas sp. H13-6]MCW4453755.1 hypothetical protein [Flavobacterium sp. MXW15]MCW4471197.1 WG repeat-containing protein [Xanthomonas sp. H13-6]